MDSFRVFSLADVAQSWVQVLRVGRFTHPTYGEFEVTADDLASMVRNFTEGVRPRPPTRLVVDYNHGDQSGRAAGWITALEVRNGAELWAQVEWTDEAAAAIRNREYQFTSAEFAWAYHDKEDGGDHGPTLLAMAITNRPFVEGMQPLTLSEQVEALMLASREELEKAREARSRRYGIRPREDGHLTKPSEYADIPDSDFADPVNYRYPITPQYVMAAYRYFAKAENQAFYNAREVKIIARRIVAALPEDNREEARKVFGLSELRAGSKDKEHAMEEQIRRLLQLDEDADVLAAVKLLRDSQTVTLGERDTLTAQLTEVSAERDELRLKLNEAKRDALLGKYEQEGKLTPAMREAWAGEMALNEPERFAKLMETLPVVVDFTERGSDKGAAAGDVQLTEAEISLGRQLGISEADLLKAKSRG